MIRRRTRGTGSATPRSLRARVALIVGVLVAGAMLGSWATGFLDRLGDQTVDVRFDVRGAVVPHEAVAVVGVDDATFDELGEQWPFTRAYHAEVIDRLVADGALVVAYDVQFTEESDDIAADNRLIRAVDRADNVVLATTEVDDDGDTRIFGGDGTLERIGARAGNALIEPSPGGTIRRLPFAVEGLPSFPVAAAELALGRPVEPVSDGGRLPLIAYAGGPGTIPTVAFVDVLLGRFAAGTFADRVVVVGAVAPSLQDVHATSTTGSKLMAGPEIAANAIATVLDGFPLRQPPAGVDAVLIAALALAMPLVAIWLRLRWLLGAGVALAGAYVLAAQLLFEHGTVLALVYQLGAIVLGTVGTIVVLYTTEAFERERVRALFGRFAPDQIVDAVLARTDGDLRLGGERLVASVLFADLRGFTAFAERLLPEDVIRVLNRYLEEMSGAIHDREGTVVSFMGDGIMAAFGAPIEQADHADRAVATAAEMSGPRLEAFNAWLAAEGLGGPFRLGVGVASGPVMSGNVGSDRRLEYAAVGSTTNLAARLQELTKETGHGVLVSDATREALQHGAELAEAGRHELRGSSTPQRLWTLA